jgi:hypothetical protein
MEKKLFLMPVAVVVGALVLAVGFYASRVQDDVLSVTGSAKRSVTADTAKLTLHWSRSTGVSDLRGGYIQMKQDENQILSFLGEKGFGDADRIVSAISLEEPNKYNPGMVQEYTLRQYVTVTTADITKVADLAKNLQPLVDRGIVLAPQQPEYYYGKLAELRIELLGDAVKDARARAEIIATNGGQKLGSLMSASMGVVQVLSPDSIDVSDYGAYDTSNQQKEVMVTVRTSFRVR